MAEEFEGIRRPRDDDEAAWRAMWDDFIKDAPEPCPPGVPEDTWQRVLNPGESTDMWLAVDGADRPVGFVLSIVFPYSFSLKPLCYLLDLYVAPEARGTGLGRRLIERLAAEGREKGWLKLMWMTQSDNDRARALYDKVATRSDLVRYDLGLGDY